MIDHFVRHRALFEALVAELHDESGVERIALDFVRPQGGLEEQELAKYRQALRSLGLEGGVDLVHQRGDVWLYYQNEGLGISGASKGFLHTARFLRTQETELGGAKTEPGVYFRSIEDGWYLFLMSD